MSWRMHRRRTNLLFLFVAAFLLVITFNNFIFPSRSTAPLPDDADRPSSQQRAPPPQKPASPPIAQPQQQQQQHQIHEYVKPELDDIANGDPAGVQHPIAHKPTIEQAGKPKQKPMGQPRIKPSTDAVEMVVATRHKENITWLHDYLPDWKKNIYVVDDSDAELTVPKNKGREAMVYLTYIIDRYDSLPGNIIFHHAERFQWHNDNPDYDALTLLQRFRFDHLRDQGYVNLRCAWVLGCPAEIHPIADDTPGDPNEPIHSKHVYKAAFEELFPNSPVPETIGVPCCSQFALRRELIQRRPRAEYIRYRDWLIESTLHDSLSGRVLEYVWHIMFGKNAVHCPNAQDCYCKTYGLCNLPKCNEKGCEGQYILPPFSNLPKGWPKIGWDKKPREWSGPE